MSELALFLGRFHPLLVHFPIVLLLLAVALELRAMRAARNSHSSYSAPDGGRTAILIAGAVAALITAGAGLLLGGSGGYAGTTFDWHQRFGVLVAFGAVLSLGAWIAARRSLAPGAAIAYRLLLGVTAMMIVVAGHFGATLTHGEGYLTEHAPAPVRGLLAQLLGGRESAPRMIRADQAVAYTTLVRPILESRCVRCHGAAKAEGKLRLDSPEGDS